MQQERSPTHTTLNTDATDDTPRTNVGRDTSSLSKEEQSTIKALDSSAVQVDVASIITQVSRSDTKQASSTARKRNVSAPITPPTTSSASSRPQRRSFLARLLCCAPKPGAGSHAGQISLVVPSNPSFLIPNRRDGAGLKGKKSFSSSDDLIPPGHRQKKCLALDLDETLVHSSFQPMDRASFMINIVIDGIAHNIYVMKRPGVDQFIQRLAQFYEIIVYTASLSKYADPLLDLLDPQKHISRRLFRENCVFYDGHYVKDLSLLSRDISQTIIVDNCPTSYIFHPENAIDCTSFFDDPNDVELWQIADFLESIRLCDDVRSYCRSWREWCKQNPNPSIPDSAG
eukprot:gene8579-9452_t